jgi:hypothetical protein
MGLDLTHFIPVTCHEPNSGYEIITAEELASNPSYIHAFGSVLEEHDGIFRLYYQALGYQRKGMNSRFYKDFECDYYFDLITVEKSLQLFTRRPHYFLRRITSTLQNQFYTQLYSWKQCLFRKLLTKN